MEQLKGLQCLRVIKLVRLSSHYVDVPFFGFVVVVVIVVLLLGCCCFFLRVSVCARFFFFFFGSF